MTDSQDSVSKAKKFWFVVIALLGFVLSNFSTSFIFLKMRPTYAMAITESVLRALGGLILAATIAFTIADLLRTQGRETLSKKRVFAVTGLMLVAMVLAFMSFRASSELKKFDRFLQETNLETKQKIIQKLNGSESTEKKSKLSHLYAQVTYEDEGKIIEYLRPDGKSVAYVPSPETMNNRDMLLFLKTHRKMSPPTDIFIGIVWPAALIAAIGLLIRDGTRGSRTPNKAAADGLR